MSAVLGTLREQADYVVIDSPPTVLVTDAAVLATQVDGVLLVLSLGKVKREMARKAKTLLENVSARILGVVVSNAPYDARDFRDYYAASG